MPPLEELWKIVNRIPAGRISSYGEVGRALKHPASGYFVGRWMTQCPPEVPWWRVVGKDGSILLGKRSPELGLEQQTRLIAEGVNVEGGRASASAFVNPDDLLDPN